MNFISPELDIHLLKHMDANYSCLYFKFKGKFTQQTSEASTRAWTAFMKEHPDTSFEFVWDCMEMNGFELKARKLWYEAMKQYQNRIKKVYVVCDRIMIRSAAKVMLQLFGIPSQIERSEDQLPSAVRL